MRGFKSKAITIVKLNAIFRIPVFIECYTGLSQFPGAKKAPQCQNRILET